MGTRVFVGNVDPRVTAEQLEDFFSEVGGVASSHIPLDRKTKEPRGFAFVEFADEEQAELAIEALDDSMFWGRRLRLSLALGTRQGDSRGDGRGRFFSDEPDLEDRGYRDRRAWRTREDEDYSRRRRDERRRRGGRHGSDRVHRGGTNRRIE